MEVHWVNGVRITSRRQGNSILWSSSIFTIYKNKLQIAYSIIFIEKKDKIVENRDDMIK